MFRHVRTLLLVLALSVPTAHATVQATAPFHSAVPSTGGRSAALDAPRQPKHIMAARERRQARSSTWS